MHSVAHQNRVLMIVLCITGLLLAFNNCGQSPVAFSESASEALQVEPVQDKPKIHHMSGFWWTCTKPNGSCNLSSKWRMGLLVNSGLRPEDCAELLANTSEEDFQRDFDFATDYDIPSSSSPIHGRTMGKHVVGRFSYESLERTLWHHKGEYVRPLLAEGDEFIGCILIDSEDSFNGRLDPGETYCRAKGSVRQWGEDYPDIIAGLFDKENPRHPIAITDCPTY